MNSDVDIYTNDIISHSIKIQQQIQIEHFHDFVAEVPEECVFNSGQPVQNIKTLIGFFGYKYIVLTNIRIPLTSVSIDSNLKYNIEYSLLNFMSKTNIFIGVFKSKIKIPISKTFITISSANTILIRIYDISDTNNDFTVIARENITKVNDYSGYGVINLSYPSSIISTKIYFLNGTLTYIPFKIENNMSVYALDCTKYNNVEEFTIPEVYINGIFDTIPINNNPCISLPLQEYLPKKIRYIRDWINGSTIDNKSAWIEIQAYDNNEINIALNKPVTAIGNLSGNNLSIINDGQISPDIYTVNTDGLSWVTIDLQDLYTIDRLKIWHYYKDERTFHNTKTEVSDNGIDWYIIFDSASEGEYAESVDGHEIFLSKLAISPKFPSKKYINPKLVIYSKIGDNGVYYNPEYISYRHFKMPSTGSYYIVCMYSPEIGMLADDPLEKFESVFGKVDDFQAEVPSNFYAYDDNLPEPSAIAINNYGTYITKALQSFPDLFKRMIEKYNKLKIFNVVPNIYPLVTDNSDIYSSDSLINYNYILNGDFNIGNVYGWIYNNMKIGLSFNSGPINENVVKLIYNNNADGKFMYPFTVSTAKSKKFKIEFIAKADQPIQISNIYIQENGGSYRTFCDMSVALTTEWKEFSIIGTSPSDCISSLRLVLRPSNNISNIIYITNISVQSSGYVLFSEPCRRIELPKNRLDIEMIFIDGKFEPPYHIDEKNSVRYIYYKDSFLTNKKITVVNIVSDANNPKSYLITVDNTMKCSFPRNSKIAIDETNYIVVKEDWENHSYNIITGWTLTHENDTVTFNFTSDDIGKTYRIYQTNISYQRFYKQYYGTAVEIPWYLMYDQGNLLTFINGFLINSYNILPLIKLKSLKVIPMAVNYKSNMTNGDDLLVMSLPGYYLYEKFDTINTNGIITLNKKEFPFSKQYMLVFLNGKFINPDDIVEISSYKFAIKNVSSTNNLCIYMKKIYDEELLYISNLFKSVISDWDTYINTKTDDQISTLLKLNPINNSDTPINDLINPNQYMYDILYRYVLLENRYSITDQDMQNLLIDFAPLVQNGRIILNAQRTDISQVRYRY